MLVWKVKKLWSMKTLVVIPKIEGALGTMNKRIRKYVKVYADVLGGAQIMESFQKTTMLGTTRTVWKVLEKLKVVSFVH